MSKLNVRIGQIVDAIESGLPFVNGDLDKALDVVLSSLLVGQTLALPDGETIEISPEIKEKILPMLAEHGQVARMVGADFIEALAGDKTRSGMVAKYNRLVEEKNAQEKKIRAYDVKKVSPYNLDAMIHWAIDVEEMSVNEHTVEVGRGARPNSAASSGGKLVGPGKGHRNSIWMPGTYRCPDSRKLAGFTLILTDNHYSVVYSGNATLDGKLDAPGRVKIGKDNYVQVDRDINPGDVVLEWSIDSPESASAYSGEINKILCAYLRVSATQINLPQMFNVQTREELGIEADV